MKTTDVLRAGVVLLHASLEDALRVLIRDRLPSGTAEVLNEVPLCGLGRARADKFGLGALVVHRGKTVEEVIQESVDQHYGQISFNDATEIVTRLNRIGVSYDDEGLNLLARIDEMIQRRHSIVHEADHNPNKGTGEYHAKGINPETLESYVEAVRAFVENVLTVARAV